MNRNSLWFTFILTIFSGGILTCAFSVNAVARNEVMNEKLLNAIRDADVQAVSASLSGGADANAKDEDGLTALMYAAMYAGTDCVKLLLAKGADPNDKNNLGGAPPVTEKRASERAQGGRPQLSPRLGLGGNLGGTPLMFAALERNPEAIKLLLAAGADVNVRSNNNSTALILAAQMGDPATVKLLLEKSAEVNSRDDWGYTALLYAAAAENDDPALLKALLAKGAEINVKAKDGETALTLAGRKGRTEIVRLLKQAGAKE